MRKLLVWSTLGALLLAVGVACAADIVPPVSGKVSGWISSQAGEAVSGAQVILVMDKAKFETQSDEDGYFLLADVPQGLGALTVQKAGYSPRQVKLEVGKEQELKITLEPLFLEPSLLVGQVLDAETGRGIWRAEVAAALTAASQVKPERTLTDAKGYWRLDLRPGEYLVTVRHAQYQEYKESVTVKAGQVTTLNIKLVSKPLPPAFIHGVVQAGGERELALLPVPGARVILAMENQHRWEAVTDDAGFFRFTALPPGRGLVIVVKAGYKPWQEQIQLKAGEALAMRVILEPLPVKEALVYGQVKDMKTAKPIPFARIQALAFESSLRAPRFVTADNQGYYKLALAPGRYVLEAQHPEYFPRQESAELFSGRQLRVDFLLRPVQQEPSVVLGMVYEAEFATTAEIRKLRKPVAGAEVILAGQRGEYGCKTGPDGRFEFSFVEPGPYRLSVHKEGYRLYQRMLTIPQGEKIELSIPLAPGGTKFIPQ